jgi:Tfp pilus assembly ATPase PilU
MTKQPNRIQVKETTLIDRYIFEGKLEEIIEMLQDWKNEGEWEGIVIDYDDETSYQLYKHREETDKEYDRRMKEMQKAENLKAKERRRKEYEKLKKEFEDT